MSEDFSSEYWSGQGPAFLAELDSNDEPLGSEFIGDAPAIRPESTPTRVKIKENVTGNRNTAASFISNTDRGVTITLQSTKPEHLKHRLQGDLTVSPAGSVTDEAVTGHHDKFLTLAHVKCSNLVLTNSAGSTTYVANTDYVFHGDEGMVEILSTGSITDGEALLADYDYAAQKRITVNPRDRNYMLVCPAINRARDGKRGRLIIYKLNLDPGSIELIQDGDEGERAEIRGELLLADKRPAGDQLFRFDAED